MKKIWLALLLTPCLTFAAYPIYEDEHEKNDSRLSAEDEQIIEDYKALQKRRQALRIKQYAVALEEEVQKEEAMAQENAVQKKGEIALEQETAQADGSSERSAATPPSEQHKQAAAADKSASGKKSPTARSKVQRSRQNPNRPRVTQRKQGESHAAQGSIEAVAPPESESYEQKTNEHADNRDQSDAKKNSSIDSQKKSSYKEQSNKSASRRKEGNRTPRQSKRAYSGRAKYQEKKIKSHHPGKRAAAPE